MIITSQTYEVALSEASGLVLLDVWAPSCPPCRALEPVIDELAGRYQGKLVVAKLNADDELTLAKTLGVRGLPTVRLLYNGKIISQWVGETAVKVVGPAVAAAVEAAQ